MKTLTFPNRVLAPILAALMLCAAGARADLVPARPSAPPTAPAEVRGTWVTTTANTAIATPADTAATMRRLRDIGLNTVYVEVWKNGYTQYPSQVLKRTIGVDRRPNLMPQDPSDTPETLKRPARDLLGETLIEAHRNGLVYIAWFEYGFMAAHKDTMNHLRKQKPEWLSRDIKGSEVAPNGFVWLNPLHPEARRFLLDLVLEAIDNYDLDGVQLDDRIVWPYVTMGYDDYTKKVYAAEHDGRQPPADHKDPEWMRWRAAKVDEYSKMFVQEVRARRPGIIISLSPAVYPWCWENYLLRWPEWAAWTAKDALAQKGDWVGNNVTPRWDEFVPQNYRFSYDAYEKTWRDQLKHMNALGLGRIADMYPGIRVVGEGKDSTWDDLKKSIELARASGNNGHVLWFSRGVLDVFPSELAAFYDVAAKGHAPHPRFGASWRPGPIALKQQVDPAGWLIEPAAVPPGDYILIGKSNGVWRELALTSQQRAWLRGERATHPAEFRVSFDQSSSAPLTNVELLIDRRRETSRPFVPADGK